MPLSVLSALARQDVDPWQEAAQLARLPGLQANRRLRLLIEALPGRSSAIIDPTALATRLLKLLPGREAPPKPNHPARNFWIFLYVMVMAFVMCAQYISADHGTPANGSDTDAPPVSDHAVKDKTP